MGYKNKNIQLQELFKKSIIFLILMITIVIISNPALIHPVERSRYLMIQKAQAEAMGFGWDVAYRTGPGSWYLIISEFYGHWLTLLLLLAGLGIGLYKKETRLTNILILTWVLPMLVYIMFFVAIKPKHLLMPIALPLFSSLANIIPPFDENKKRWKKDWYLIIPFLILIIQFGRNVIWDYQYIQNAFQREEEHPALSFYTKMDLAVLDCLPDDRQMTVFRDVRAYVPESDNLNVVMSWKVIDYEYVEELNPDIIVLQMQKIYDYTKPDLINSALDKKQMQLTIDFYSDAGDKNIRNYTMVLDDNYGLVFLKDDLSDILNCER